MISARWLSSQPLKHTDRIIGHVFRVWFNLDTGQGLGLLVKSGRQVVYAPRSACHLEEEHLHLPARTDLQTIPPHSRLSQVVTLGRHVLGAGVETPDGRRVGILHDILLTAPDWRIAQIVVQDKGGDRLLPRNSIVRLQDNLVIVTNEVLDRHAIPWSPAPAQPEMLLQ